MRAFVTGATGFAGSRLSRHLASLGFEVRALARPTSDLQALDGKRIEIVTGDVRDLKSLENGMRGADLVFHLAAIFRQVGKSDSEYEAVNVQGTKNAVEAAARTGIKRFVHCSTVGVHGDTGSTPATEDSPLIEAKDSYNRTKLAAERWARDGVPEHPRAWLITTARNRAPGDCCCFLSTMLISAPHHSSHGPSGHSASLSISPIGPHSATIIIAFEAVVNHQGETSP